MECEEWTIRNGTFRGIKGKTYEVDSVQIYARELVLDYVNHDYM